MTYNAPWSRQERQLAIKVLRKHLQIKDAIDEICKGTGRTLTPNGLHAAFRGAGLSTPSEYLRVDPVERAAAISEATLRKKEHADLVQRLAASEERERVRDALRRYKITPIKRREFNSRLRDTTAVALASDWHVEEQVTKIQTAGYNESDLAKSDVKQARFFSGVRWLINHHREDKTLRIRDLVLWLGGDFMTGSIHEDPVRQLSPLQTMRWLTIRLYSGIRDLLTCDLDRIVIPCSYGNHDRTTKTAHYSTGAENSYAWIMYQELADRFAGEKRVQFCADVSEFQYVDVYDKRFGFHHGHRINYGGGVGGVTIPTRKAVAQWDKVNRADLWHFGHFHTYYDFEMICGNGSLIGYNPFAMGIKATPEPPQQAFYLFDSKRGKHSKSPIWVEP